MNLNTLSAYRAQMYRCFSRYRDGLMNLNDALLTDTAAHTFVELTLSPFFERAWSSAYAACSDGKIDREALRKVRIQHAPVPPANQPYLIAGDASTIARPCSPTAQDRTYNHVANLPQGSKCTTPGWQYSFIKVVPTEPSSWVYTLDVERISSKQTPGEVMAEQLAKVIPLLGVRPLFLGDGGYGNVSFLLNCADIACDTLLRLAKNRVLYRAAPPRPEHPGRGRPRLDGAVFDCKDTATHGVPDAHFEGVNDKEQPIQVDRWDNLHFEKARSITVSLLRVTRQGGEETTRNPRVCWFVFSGETCPELSEIPTTYACRYRIEHGFRFKKQDLLWESVHLRTPARFSVWTDLVCCVENQLFLARESGLAKRQPWEREELALTPQQVRRGMNRILGELGTPAGPCRVRGNSPGRRKGEVRAKYRRFKPVFKGSDKKNLLELV